MCIPACNGVGVYPSMQLGRGVCILACNLAGAVYLLWPSDVAFWFALLLWPAGVAFWCGVLLWPYD